MLLEVIKQNIYFSIITKNANLNIKKMLYLTINELKLIAEKRDIFGYRDTFRKQLESSFSIIFI